MAEQEKARQLYLLRAKELREVAGALKHAELQTALLSLAMQYERLAELPKPEQPH